MYARGWGRIVNISSAHGCRASANKVAYVTAKHASRAFQGRRDRGAGTG
jgi:3-hydroxybutyrate dehydrogenase